MRYMRALAWFVNGSGANCRRNDLLYYLDAPQNKGKELVY